ncbi:MAG: proton-conducting transporter membrane subunit [Candidatus Thiodiazotropha endolucinida]
MVLGWDGLGLISFVLVIYYQRDKALGAGLVTALINRVGDVLMLARISLLRESGYWELWGLSLEEGVVGLVLVMVAVLSITKRAQIPFSYWLPAAIIAPTPVSALVHSSTLVTAGVYLMVRLLIGVGELQVGGFVRSLLLVVSLLTNVMAGISACFEVDLKKIVALSTLRQLGIIVMALAMGYYSLAFFHLITHALFKSLMFIRVGRVIHLFGDSQDLRDVGGLWERMP